MAAHIGFVDVGGQLPVVVVEDRHAVFGANTGIVGHVPGPDRTAQLIDGIAVYVATFVIGPRAEIGDLVLVVGVVESEVPLEVLRAYGGGIDTDLDTAVNDRPGVGQDGSESRGQRDILRHVEVLGLDVVEVEREVEARIEGSEVDTDVRLRGGFPAELAVSELAVGISRFAVVGGVRITVEGPEVAHAVLVAGRTVAGAEFELVEPLDVLHPGLR